MFYAQIHLAKQMGKDEWGDFLPQRQHNFIYYYYSTIPYNFIEYN